MLEVFPNVETRLNQSARIAHNLVLESAVVMDQVAREQDLTASAKREVRGLLLDQSAAPKADPASDSIVEWVMKRMKPSFATVEVDYQDTEGLPS